MTVEIKKVQGYTIAGVDQVFETRAEVDAFLRKPKIKAALDVLTKDEALTTWLIDNASAIKNAFASTSMRRLTKADHAKITKAIDAIKEAGLKDTQFLLDLWPEIEIKYRTVKKMDDAEKELAARNSLQAIEGGNEELANWIVTVKDAIFDAYEAGVEKRAVPQALLDYQARVKAEKAAKSADTSADIEDDEE